MASRGKMIGMVAWTFIAACSLAGHAAAQQGEEKETPNAIKIGRFSFDPNTPIKDLFPTPPQQKPVAGPVLTDDLGLTPEVEFQARPEQNAEDQLAFQLAKIRFANSDKTDAFMIALIETRADLAGLPFIMGKECRSSSDLANRFELESQLVREILLEASFDLEPSKNAGAASQYLMHYYLEPPAAKPSAPRKPTAREAAEKSWSSYRRRYGLLDKTKVESDVMIRARIAALMQVLAPASPEVRMPLIDFLAQLPQIDATKALARLSIFSAEDEVREAATNALRSRPREDYTDVLLKGLRYPWPAVAMRSAKVITQLRRSDLIPELSVIVALDDPRLPFFGTVDGKQVSVVRELVRVNHNRNCMLCHAPAPGNRLAAPVPAASVPVPGEPLPFIEYDAARKSPDLLIRFDVTYLRQDFSTMLAVEDAKPWPAKQRFDFLVRERTLTADEAREYVVRLTPKGGAKSSYQEAVQSALAELKR